MEMKGLLFITHQTEKYDYLQSVEIALEGGCRQIQLRMKGAPADEVEAVARRAKTLCAQFGAALYINDHVDICQKVHAAGVHLGKSDMPPSEARALLGSGFVIGASANTLSDVVSLHRQPVDYIGLGPFRQTATKTDLKPVLGMEGYRHLANFRLPVMAIGGIGIEDIAPLMQTGISGIALSSAILNADDPVEATKKIIRHIIMV
jgi:thiamine-phosphate pyrophosphorylase